MNEWQPKMSEVETGELELSLDYGHGVESVTHIHCSEGDTLFIRQQNKTGATHRISLNRHEIYNLIFNFVSFEELIAIAGKRAKKEHEDNPKQLK